MGDGLYGKYFIWNICYHFLINFHSTEFNFINMRRGHKDQSLIDVIDSSKCMVSGCMKYA